MQIIQRELVEHSDGIRGTVKIGCITSANIFVVPAALKKVMKETPNVVTNVHEGNSAYVLDELRSLKIDIGIVRTSVRAEDIQTSTILTEPLLWALPPGHPLCDKKEIHMADLKDERFLLPNTSYGLGIADDIIEACQNNGFTPNVVYWGTKTLPMLMVVMKGAGICFAPKCYEELEFPVLPVLRPISIKELETNLFMITLKNCYLSPIAQRFLSSIEEIGSIMT